MPKILQKKIPNNLVELRIENCKVANEVTSEFLKILNKKNYL